jgi:hypothetical protein
VVRSIDPAEDEVPVALQPPPTVASGRARIDIRFPYGTGQVVTMTCVPAGWITTPQQGSGGASAWAWPFAGLSGHSRTGSPSLQEASHRLAEEAREGDFVLTLGAGSVWHAGEELLERRAGATGSRGHTER